MRSFRSLAGLALATLLGCTSLFASASDRFERFVVYTAQSVGSFGEAVARYDVEQTYQIAAAGEAVETLRSDLRREGNGFRLASAERQDMPLPV